LPYLLADDLPTESAGKRFRAVLARPGIYRLPGAHNGQAAILRVTFRIDWTMFDGVPASKTLPTLMTDHGINKK